MNGSTKSKDFTSEKKDSGTIATGGTPKPSSTGSDGPSTLGTKQENNMELIDDCFYVKTHPWGTVQSYDAEGNGLVTSLTEDKCIAATRWYLKGLQDGFTEGSTRYDGTVGGKL